MVEDTKDEQLARVRLWLAGVSHPTFRDVRAWVRRAPHYADRWTVLQREVSEALYAGRLRELEQAEWMTRPWAATWRNVLRGFFERAIADGAPNPPTCVEKPGEPSPLFKAFEWIVKSGEGGQN